MNPDVDLFFANTGRWKEEMEKLRSIVLECGLTEELKWRQPCYTFQGNNVLIISGFKNYCALNMFKGALLADTNGILVAPGENTQSGRQIRFTSVQEIIDLEQTLKAYIFESIEVEKAGLKVEYKKTSEYNIPEELQKKLDEIPVFKTAFRALTPGRQKAYILYFSQAKQSKTRIARIEKFIPKIMDGKGLNDY